MTNHNAITERWSNYWPPPERTSPRLCSCISWLFRTPQHCQDTPCWSTCQLDEPASMNTVEDVTMMKRNPKIWHRTEHDNMTLSIFVHTQRTYTRNNNVTYCIYIYKNAYLIHISSPLPWHVRSTERAAACPAGISQTASCIQYLSSGSPDDLIQSPPSETGEHTVTVQYYTPIQFQPTDRKKKKKEHKGRTGNDD